MMAASTDSARRRSRSAVVSSGALTVALAIALAPGIQSSQ